MRRRVFLRGAGGLALGLPILESLGSRASAQDEVKGNLLIFAQANGMIQGADWWGTPEPDFFWPKQQGDITTAILEAQRAERATGILAPHASKLLLVRRVKSHKAREGDHFVAPAFTCSYATGGNDSGTVGTESIENRVQRELSGGEPINAFVGNGSYAKHTMSFGEGGRPNSLESNPADIFSRVLRAIPEERIGSGGNADPGVLDPMQKQRKSINDLLKRDIDRLRASTQLSAADQARLSDHFDHIRTVELAVEEEQKPGGIAACNPPDSIASGDDTADVALLRRYVDLHAQVIALAFACGVKNAGSIQIGTGNAGMSFGQPYGFHAISHRVTNNDGTGSSIGVTNAQNYHKQVDRIHAEMFLSVLNRLNEVSAGSGTLLDQTVAVYTSGMQNGAHHMNELPFVIGGGGALGLRQGKYIDTQFAELKKVWCTIGQAVGVRNPDGTTFSQFGNSSQAGGMLATMRV